MGPFRAIVIPLVALATLPLSSCHLLTPFEVRGGEDADGDGDADADADLDVVVDADGDAGDPCSDADGPPDPVSMVMVVDSVSVLHVAACDVDGDGELDSAVADLGGELGPLFANAVDGVFSTALREGERPMIHFRRVDDRRGPEAESALVAGYGGLDTDLPIDSRDDFDGAEPFYAMDRYLDPCGEPLHIVEGVRVDCGEVSGGEGTLAIAAGNDVMEFHVIDATGHVDSDGVAFDLQPCGFATVREFGRTGKYVDIISRYSALELIVGGGGAFGLDLPGVQPDIDVDGDGLERIELRTEEGEGDDEKVGQVARCIDGDRTVIEGRDCWDDPRIADAYSMAFSLRGVSARYAGRHPGWEYNIDEPCEEPPEESFFDTIPPGEGDCAVLDERCDPLSPSPCCDSGHRCSGADRVAYRCSAPCAPVPCEYGDYIGACGPLGDGAYCLPVARDEVSADCGGSPLGCSTEYGVHEETECVDAGDDHTPCLETCVLPDGPCAPDHWCVPLVFEEGGVCIFR